MLSVLSSRFLFSFFLQLQLLRKSDINTNDLSSAFKMDFFGHTPGSEVPSLTWPPVALTKHCGPIREVDYHKQALLKNRDQRFSSTNDSKCKTAIFQTTVTK